MRMELKRNQYKSIFRIHILTPWDLKFIMGLLIIIMLKWHNKYTF